MIKVSKDKDFVDSIRKALADNDGYCPCRATKTEDTKCICKDFREMIENNIEGTCHCGLYYNELPCISKIMIKE